jgi:hypothetical protein
LIRFSQRYRIDWSQINGIDVLTAQTVIAEPGADLSAFPSKKQFASWLGLCPSNETSGGKILNRRTRKVVNRATVAFRNAASTLGAKSELSGFAIPPSAYPSGRSQGHHRHGSQVSLPVLQAHQTRAAIH